MNTSTPIHQSIYVPIRVMTAILHKLEALLFDFTLCEITDIIQHYLRCKDSVYQTRFIYRPSFRKLIQIVDSELKTMRIIVNKTHNNLHDEKKHLSKHKEHGKNYCNTKSDAIVAVPLY